jgi:hypothetical protein
MRKSLSNMNTTLTGSPEFSNAMPHLSFATFLERLRADAWALEEIAHKKAIQVSWDGRRFFEVDVLADQC